MEKGAFDIAKNVENKCIMGRPRSNQELANKMNNIGGIGSSNKEIDKTTNKLSIKCSIG